MSKSTEDGTPDLNLELQSLALARVRDPQRYLILGEHGRGGIGRVSRAHDRELGRDVAIKEVLSRDQVNEARFLREALITARLEHPGIVTVHEAGRWPDGTPFYAMKLVSGRSLRELLVERTTADERLALLHHVIAVADAIAYAHGRNIVHRDLKPANVIVGDFGETVVIDWGLAKDLNAAEEVHVDGGPFRVPSDPELTVAGAVLGTPAYMAPEQARGEQVDRRADVFAIGTMLWELCAIGRAPPEDPQVRYRLLRRAGIDKDLAAIIEKALDPLPERRYPHAGALAADLKAFKSGARIGARSYSLVALLTHWVRRHRALAISVTTAMVLAVTGVVFYVRNIAIERDRSNAARREAEVERRNAQHDRSELVLKHSELLLQSDPTSAVRALETYGGEDDVRRRRLLAEAHGRGVASAEISPHSSTVWFLVGEPSGAIVSLGEDRKIQRTDGSTTTTLADDVSTSVLIDYAPARHLLAYAATPSGIAVLDLATRATTRLGTDAPPATAMALSPDGARLATLDGEGTVTIWAIASGKPSRREAIPAAVDLKFATPTRLVIREGAGLRTVSLDDDARYQVAVKASALDARAGEMIAGDSAGTITLLSSNLEVVAQRSVCRRRVNTIRFVGDTNLATFSCLDGIVGLVRFDLAARTLVDAAMFATQGPALEVMPDRSGRWVVAYSEGNVAYVYDVEKRLVQHYQGKAARVSSVSPPSPGFDHVVVGYLNGTVRVWPLPSPAGRVVLESPSVVFHIAFTPDGKALAADGSDGVVRRVGVDDGRVTELRGHIGPLTSITVAPDGGSIASVGSDLTVRVWRASDGAPLRTFTSHAAEISDLGYIEGGRRIVSAGADGRLLAWTPAGTDETPLFQQPVPLVAVEILPQTDHAVVADATGAVWYVAPPAAARLVRSPNGDAVRVLMASPDGRLIAVGTSQGSVTVYDTRDWTVRLTTTVAGGVRRITFDPKARDLAIASQDGHVQLAALDASRALRWRQVPASARDIAYGPDGETIAFVCADGGTWLYALRDDVWAYARDHFSDTTSGVFSPDGRWFASGDRRGIVVVRDVAATFAAAPRPTSPPRRSIP